MTLSSYSDQIEFKNHTGKPTFGFRKFEIRYNFWDYDNQTPEHWLGLQENEYETFDSWFPQFVPSHKGSFYRNTDYGWYDRNTLFSGQKNSSSAWSSLDTSDDMLLTISIWNFHEKLFHKR